MTSDGDTKKRLIENTVLVHSATYYDDAFHSKQRANYSFKNTVYMMKVYSPHYLCAHT